MFGRRYRLQLSAGAALLAAGGGVCPGLAFQATEQPPVVRPAEDPEISRMLVQALKTEDPDQRLEIYRKILDKEPGNTEARAGYKETKALTDQKHAAAEEDRKKSDQKRQDQSKGRTAFAGAGAAFSAGDLIEARRKLSLARSLGYSDPRMNEFERVLAQAESRANFYRYLRFGGLGAVLAAAAAWIGTLFRKREPCLEVLTGGSRGRRYRIEKDVTTIGALAQKGDEKNDIVLSDSEKTVSRFHCEIHRKGSKLYIVDCNSANGTRVDGRAIPPGRLVALSRGARIQLGVSCALKFNYERRKS